MIEQMDELYREVILDHYREPRHAGELDGAPIRVEGANPLCGDEMVFSMILEGDRITQIRFKGTGCAISQAAASMLSEQAQGKSIAEARRLIEAMKRMMQGQPLDEGLDLGDLEALAGVRKFPVRVKCAALAWNVLERALASGDTTRSA